MKQLLIYAAVMFGFAAQAGSVAAVAQEQTKASTTSQGAAEATKSVFRRRMVHSPDSLPL
jgi:hypothetical protein